MTLKRFVGFETGDVIEASSSVNATIQGTTKHNGDYALQFNTVGVDGTYSIRDIAPYGSVVSVPFDLSTAYVQFWFRMGALPAVTARVAGLGDFALFNYLRVRINTSGELFLSDLNETADSAIAATLSINVWYKISVKWVNGGNCTLQINGGTAVTLPIPGLDFAQLTFGAVQAINRDWYFDDVSIDDAEFNDGRCLRMDADGSSQSLWVGTYTDVDEVPHDSDTTYVRAVSAGIIESVTLESPVSAGIKGIVKGFYGYAIVRDEGGASALRASVNTGAPGGFYETTIFDPGATYVLCVCRAESTFDNLDNIVIGVESNASIAVRCTAMHGMVWETGIVDASAGCIAAIFFAAGPIIAGFLAKTFIAQAVIGLIQGTPDEGGPPNVVPPTAGLRLSTANVTLPAVATLGVQIYDIDPNFSVILELLVNNIWLDISDRYVSLSGRRGRDKASLISGKFKAGELHAILLNDDGLLSPPRDPTVAITIGNLDVSPFTPVRVRTINPAFTIWSGYLKYITPRGREGKVNYAELRAEDIFSVLAEIDPIGAPIVQGALTGAIIRSIFNATGLSASLLLEEAGQTVITTWFEQGTAPLAAMIEVTDTELGFLFVLKDGVVRFQDRHHRYKDASSLVPQMLITDDLAETSAYPIIYAEKLRQADAWDEIYNYAEASIREYTTFQGVHWTYEHSQQLTLSGNGGEIELIAAKQNSLYAIMVAHRDWLAQNNFTAQASQVVIPPEFVAVTNWIAPIPGTDIIAEAPVNSSDIVVTVIESTSTHLRFKIRNNNATTAKFTQVQARGGDLNSSQPITVLAENIASQAKYKAKRKWVSPSKYTPSLNDAKASAEFVVFRYGFSYPITTVEYPTIQSTAALTRFLASDITDRVHVHMQDSLTALDLDDDFYIEAINWHYEPGDNFQVTYDLSNVAGFGDFWRLGIDALGVGTMLAY